ncbi:MAG TPA: hypothetical protein VNC23_05310 [Lapillicoccus sp.]|jgi:hypothetical protein|nr:hypothetical protein [Lapillicoccus sp.]
MTDQSQGNADDQQAGSEQPDRPTREGDVTQTEHPTGEDQAAENAETELPG